MLKYLIILSIIIYIFYKIGSFFFRVGAASQQLRNMQDQQRRAAEAQKNAQKVKKGKVNGGEYIDFEEVK